MYGRHATDIIGYAYQAALFCPDCVIGALPIGDGQRFDGWALAPGVRMSTEDNLTEIAVSFGIDRTAGDTEDFPVPLFSSDSTGDDYCDACREEL